MEGKALKIEAIKKAIKDKHDKSGDKCGLYYVELRRQTGLTLEEIEPLLREIYDGKDFEFHVRQGLNGFLFFYGKKNNETKKK